MKKLLITMFTALALVVPTFAVNFGDISGNTGSVENTVVHIENARTDALVEFFNQLSGSVSSYIASLNSTNDDWKNKIPENWTDADKSKQMAFNSFLTKLSIIENELKVISGKFETEKKTFKIPNSTDITTEEYIGAIIPKYELMVDSINTIITKLTDLANDIEVYAEFDYYGSEESMLFYSTLKVLCGQLSKILTNNANLLKRNIFVMTEAINADEGIIDADADEINNEAKNVWTTFTRSVRFIRLGIIALDSYLNKHVVTTSPKANNLNREKFIEILNKTSNICDELKPKFNSVAEIK